jgi:hypothetical protein
VGENSSTASLPLSKVAVAGEPTTLASPTFVSSEGRSLRFFFAGLFVSSEGRSRVFLGLLDALDAGWFLPDRRPGLSVTPETTSAAS